MIQAKTDPDSALPGAATSRRGKSTRSLHLILGALTFALLVVAGMVLCAWVPLVPRAVRRSLSEALSQTVLFVYGAVALASLAGTPLLGWLLARSWRERIVRPGIQRGFLLALSSLVSLLLIEIGATAWRGWMHRFPSLRVTFAPSPPGEYRIVVLGGSSALGEPYRPWLSVGQIVAWRLQQAIPDRRFECEILAWLGDSLEMQHQKLANLVRRPDAVIIYAGHNEFAARFEEEREAWLGEDPGNRLLQGAFKASLSSPFCRLAFEVLSKNRLDKPPPLSGRHQLVDPPQCSPREVEEIREDFSRRLEAIVEYCERIGALAILIVPPANEAGYEPGRSTLPAFVPAQERGRFVQAFQEIRALESRDPAASAARYAAILARYPAFAEAHFRLARLLEQQGELAAAARHYLAALDNDGLPIRCPAILRAAYERVAREHPRSILIDGRRELIANSPIGLLGDHVIQDTHHPTLRGYVALAGAVLRELDRRQVFDRPLARERPLDPAACAVQFGMDAEKWAAVCKRSSEHYKRVAGYRYDPAERLAKSRRYADAARLLESGTAPVELGLPGSGTGKPRKPEFWTAEPGTTFE
jgi:hypothetical protein